MKNLTLNLEEEISILSKYRITPNELTFIKTLLILQDEENEDLFKDYIEYKINIYEDEIIIEGFKKKDSDKFKEFVVKCNGKNGTVIGIVRDDYIIRFSNGICETHKQSECEKI